MKAFYLRPAIAMIELIFAIVIMGIVLMSAPMLIATATQSTYVGIQQEGINEAASKVNMILSYAWDENNTDDNVTPPLLHTAGNAIFGPDLAKDNRTRIGIPIKSSREFFPDLNASVSLGADSGESTAADYDDVDDFNGETLTSLTTVESATTDYIETATVEINTTVSYGDDSYDGSAQYSYVPFQTTANTSSNVKNIEVKLTSTDTANADVLEKTILLRAFSCNVGGIGYAEKWF